MNIRPSIIKQELENLLERLDARQYALDNFGRFVDTISCLAPFVSRGSKIVDIGIYPGHTAVALKNLFSAEVLGVTTTQTESFKEQMRDYAISIISADVEKERLSLEDSSVDIVIAAEILEHLYNPYLFLTEAYRILKKGGVLLVSTPNLARFKNRLRFFFAGRPVMEHLHGNLKVFETNDWTHKREYTRHEVSAMLRAVGFTEIKTYFTALGHYPCSFKNMAVNMLKRVIYLSGAWKGGIISIGVK